MGFDLGATVNAAADWLCSAPIVRSVINNPIFTALLITALAAIIVLALYNHQLKGSGFKRGARAFIYVFLVGTAVLFVHHYAVVRCARRDAAQKGVRDVFSGIRQSRESGVPGISVMPSAEDAGGLLYGVPVVPPAAAPPTGVAPATRAPTVTGGQPPIRPNNIALDAGLVIEDVVVPGARPLMAPK